MVTSSKIPLKAIIIPAKYIPKKLVSLLSDTW